VAALVLARACPAGPERAGLRGDDAT